MGIPSAQVVNHIYVDGTGLWDESHFPAWGLCVMSGPSIDSMMFVGFAGARAAVSPECPDYVGADSANSASAELSGIVWALLYILSSAPDGTEWEILYDCEYAAAIAEMRCSVKQHPSLGGVISVLVHLVRLRFSIKFHHVKAHDSQPLNEFVDCVADMCSRDALMWCVHNCPLRDILVQRPHSFQWAFLEWLPDGDRQMYPPILSDQLHYSHGPSSPYLCLEPEVIGERIDTFFSGGRSGSVSESIPAPLRVVTINVRSMLDPIRRRTILAQLQKRQCHLVGLQETRSRRNAFHTCGAFHRVASIADSGNYGCDILVSATLPFAQAKEYSP